ncbi:gamma-glutamyltransferase [Micromonospora echinospora]|uniref:Gamma-glutamyltranspeptidase / glutathione hydrolase n=1 Tax=Micromonospora echinospora TaxID=1877 RepID=A0A1C4YRV3_MICEC|nr:gamma-glutamyltransferase family protein [Micromonospora echinospora]OZV77355.1 gamma-glutamyltransferase [Micromonospora echinospora]SCF23406.1 gamma-glutamyltranspeptidase / glutathione hydrolase [Micromonospora echinospora]
MTVIRPPLAGDLGAVSSTHWLASGAAMSVLERGGNAFDAAVAAGFVLQVVEPHSNGLGGDVAIALYSRSAGAARIVCGQGPTPRAATIEAFTALGISRIPAAGVLPACVPGAFGAWLRLLAEFGTMLLADVLQPAIAYAAGGYPLLPSTAQTIAVLAPLFVDEWTESARTYLPGGSTPAAGSRMRNPALAATFERLVTEAGAVSADRETQIEAAHNAFYQGFVAERIDGFLRRTEVFDSTGRRHRGLLTADDLAYWRADVEDPYALTYGDLTVLKSGPWSQGPVFLQQLALLDGFDLPAMGLNSVEYIHLLTEAAKLAFADREGWYGDPRHVPVPMAQLLTAEYTRQRRSLIGGEATIDPQPGLPCAGDPWIPQPEPDEPVADAPEWLTQLRSGIPTVGVTRAGAGNTCTVAVVDRAGNMVVAVPSGGWLKSSPVIPGLGLSLGTRAQTMWLSPGHPNTLAPGKRPRTTLSPGVVLRDGEPYLALGTPGGDQQDQWTLQTLLAATRFGLDLQAATEVPAFHIDHFPQSFAPRTARPGVVVVEASHDSSVLAGLRSRGHRLDVVPANTLGKVCAVGVDPVTGFLRAAAGARGRQAYAMCR